MFADLINATDKHYVAVLGVRDIAAADAEVLNPGSPRSLYIGLQGRF